MSGSSLLLVLLLVVQVCTNKMNLGDEVDLEDYVSRPDKISAAEIAAICQEAGMHAVRKNRSVPNLGGGGAQQGICDLEQRHVVNAGHAGQRIEGIAVHYWTAVYQCIAACSAVCMHGAGALVMTCDWLWKEYKARLFREGDLQCVGEV